MNVPLRTWLAALAVAAVAAASATAASPKPSRAEASTEMEAGAGEARGLLERFFSEENADARQPLAEQFGKVAPDNWAAVKALLHEAAPRPDLAPGTHTFETPGEDPVPPVRYVLRVPEGYEPNAPAGYPLVIGCHGTGGKGADALRLVQRILGPDLDRYLVACPDSPQPDIYRVDRVIVVYPLHVLADVRRRANVDADRTILTGYSRGGYTTWAAVLFSPTAWAGAVPMASWPLTDAGSDGAILYLQNVLNLAIQAHWGEKDIESGQTQGINTLSREAAAWFKGRPAHHFEGIEYAGQGHGLNLKHEAIRTFCASARRDPFPAEVKYLFHRLYQGRVSCVRVTEVTREEFDFRKRRVLRIQRREDLPNAKRAMWRNQGFEVTVRIPEGKNTVAIMARNVRTMEVELPAERLDFTQPVRVFVNHRTRYAKQTGVDWVSLLETARQTWDFERLVAGRVTVPAR